MPEMNELLHQAKHAFCNNDITALRDLLERHPVLQERINEPLFAFDSPAIGWVRSREMLDLLLAAGADINAKSQWWAGGFGLLHDASPELAAYAIQRGAQVDIHAAARLGLFDKLKDLVAASPDLVHARGGDGQTPLHFASTIEIAEYLLDQGADIDSLDIDHESTPAQYRVGDRQEVARYLVSRGCKTDLLMAAALGDGERASQHLDTDPACIRMSVSERYFPKRNPRAGGTIYIWTLGQNKTAHHVARTFGHEQVVELLLDRSPAELKLALACEWGDEALIRTLLARHPDLVAALAEEDERRLADAAQANDIEAVRRMLSAGWPVAPQGQHGGTPLHWAAFHGNLDMTELILRHDPPLELADVDYHATPLGWAIHGSEQGWHRLTGNYPGTVEALLRAEAKPPETIKGTAAVQEILRRYRPEN